MSTAFITHPDCHRHNMGQHHPECPERLDAIQDHLIATGIDIHLEYHEAPLASMEQLLRAHSRRHVELIADSAPEQGITHLDPDTAMNPGTWQAALRAAGAGVLATDLVLTGKVDNAFCAVRPPGHHAERTRAMGFCFFNNIAIAALHALEQWKLTRVAIIDFDVHHGNGTENILAGREDVLMVGAFQHPFYPYSGTEHPAANMLNIPLPAGTRGAAFRDMVSEHWLPRLEEYAPQMLFISAGFDAHLEDDMASLGLVEADYAWLTTQLKQIAGKHADGRIVSLLEGGYHLSALGRSVAAHLRVLADL